MRTVTVLVAVILAMLLAGAAWAQTTPQLRSFEVISSATDQEESHHAIANCPEGWIATGGGGIERSSSQWNMESSYPRDYPTPTGWNVDWRRRFVGSSAPQGGSFVTYVICVGS